MLLLIRHQLGDEFRQRLVDDLFLIIGQRLVDLFQQIQIGHQLGGSFGQRVIGPIYFRTDNISILFIKFWICHVCLTRSVARFGA